MIDDIKPIQLQRRVMPTLILKDIIGVAPMVGPSKEILEMHAEYLKQKEQEKNGK